MIVDVWMPKYSIYEGSKQVIRYDLADLNFFFKNKKKGWKVRYKCDICLDNSIKNTTSHVFFNKKNNFNTLEKQICRNCRSKISEYEIKSNFIPFDVFKTSLELEGYQLITNSKMYNESSKKSQFKLNVICKNGHDLKVTWNNWSKGKRCRICYEIKKYENAVKNKFGWERYKFLVWYYTEKNYKKYKKLINPNLYPRGNKYHLDHKFSISEGFKKNIPPKIIASKENLEVILANKNLIKHAKCSITLNELNVLTNYLSLKEI